MAVLTLMLIEPLRLHSCTGAAFTVALPCMLLMELTMLLLGLTHASAGNTPVGVCVEIDPATTQLYVVFRNLHSSL